MKHFLDSVHGTIDIPKEYCDKIIDTCYFQRLRRIEQNSCRSVYPSARHDRFIHSLGVYHLGVRISDNIMNKCDSSIFPINAKQIFETYRMACLLHDVGHTPFSHTFEDYFDIDAVEESLKNELDNDDFNHDVDNRKKKAATHEVISAYVAIIAFKKELKELNINLVLFARMITGYKFLDKTNKEPYKSFENAMIELIHGDIIDADGLDYVCRDVWAGGYKNLTINLDRLISSIEIDCNDKKEYSVLYSSKALNEIETVLNIKNFQYLYVIKHHKVLLEQHMLVEAMKSAACFHLNLPDTTQDERDNALRKLCDFTIFTKGNELPKVNYKLFRPTDDDFVTLMKLYDSNEYYIKQWLSRKFNAISLWKSKLEYFHIFRPIFDKISKENANIIHSLLTSNECTHYLCTKFRLSEHDIIIIEVESKVRTLDANKINVRLNDSIQPYSELSHDVFSVIGEKLPFCYMYVDLETFEQGNKKLNIERIIRALQNFLSQNIERYIRKE